MTVSLNKLVAGFLKDNPNQKFTARDIAEWMFIEHRSRCEEKRTNSKQKLESDNDLIMQIQAEIGSNRPTIQKKFPDIKTTEDRPRLYYYSTVAEEDEVEKAEDDEQKDGGTKGSFTEAELYPILAGYLSSEHAVFPKRIDEKTASNRHGANGNKWLFPDLVGMENLGADWDQEVELCVKYFGGKRVRLWSFEVKKILNSSNVRESWFQTVSNSSWANFGYLVAVEINASVMTELRMLAGAHGIGVIRLNPIDPAESEILIPAQERVNIDWNICNRLVKENRDFREFIELVKEFHQTGRVKVSDWDYDPY